MIWSSDMPTACICAMRSLAGLEKWHSSMEQVATESLQPHWQAIRAPTRRASTEGFSAAVWANAASAKARATRIADGGRTPIGETGGAGRAAADRRSAPLL